MDPDVKKELSSSKMRLRAKSPYFAVLASYLKPVQVPEQSSISTAATDAVRLYINRTFWLKLSSQERDFVLAHEVMHCALGHCDPKRFMGRDPLLWNIACDFVINLILKNAQFNPPQQCLVDEKFAKMTAEEVYEILRPDFDAAMAAAHRFMSGDLMQTPDGEAAKSAKDWQNAKASAAAATKMMGDDPLCQQLQIHVEQSTTDWRNKLWQELAMSSSDFVEWDKRLMNCEIFAVAGEGTNGGVHPLYCESIEEQEEYTLKCAMYIDSSGSMIDVLGRCVGEIRQIQSLYKQLEVDVYFGDAGLYGPFKLEDADKPVGGGGTSFVPFFQMCEDSGKYDKTLVFTDLYGEFPAFKPKAKTVWVVPPGGDTNPPPFGDVVRLVG